MLIIKEPMPENKPTAFPELPSVFKFLLIASSLNFSGYSIYYGIFIKFVYENFVGLNYSKINFNSNFAF